MKQWLVISVFIGLAVSVHGEEHQRVRSAESAASRWEWGLDGTLTPLGLAWWTADLNLGTGLVLAGVWSIQGGQGYSWTSDPLEGRIASAWGPASLSLGWSGEGLGGRWNLRLGGQEHWSQEPRAANQSLSGMLGLQTVADPVIVGVSLEASSPCDWSVLSLRTGLSFQEVLNDTTTWTLAVSPRVEWYQGLAFWTLSFSWSVGWYQGSQGASTGVSTASGQPWTWSTSIDQSGEFPPTFDFTSRS